MPSTEVHEFRHRSADGTILTARALGVFEPMASALLQLLEGQRDQWHDGYTLWLGWGPVVLRATDGGYAVESPDYGAGADPATDRTDDLSRALWITTMLTTVVETVGVEAAEIGFNDDVIAVRRWDTEERVALTRNATENANDSGWFIQPYPPRDWKHEDLVRVKAWEVLQARPACARALGLPVGIDAVVDRDRIEAVVRDSDKAVLARDL